MCFGRTGVNQAYIEELCHRVEELTGKTVNAQVSVEIQPNSWPMPASVGPRNQRKMTAGCKQKLQ